MAIVKMKKLTLISFHEQKDQLLKSIQALKNFEVVDLPSTDLGDYDVSPKEVEQLRTTIKECETRIDQINSALSFLQSYLPKSSLLEKLRYEKKEFTLKSLSDEVAKFSPKDLSDDLLNKQIELENIEEHIKDLQEDEAFLTNWKKLHFSLGEIEKTNYITAKVGTVPQHKNNQYINELIKSDALYVEEIYQNKDDHGILISYDITAEEHVQQILNESHFDDLTTQFDEIPGKSLKAIKKNIQNLKSNQKKIKSDLEKMREEEWQLKLADEYYHAKIEREKSKLFLADENHLFIMEGWLEETEVESFKTVLNETITSENHALLVEDVKEEDYGRVPTKLNNHALVAPFENITEMYNLPKYNEIDPTPFLAPFYFVFFGMMVADLGYGLLLFLATLLALKLFNFNPSMKKNLTFFHYLSYSTMLWGLIYGSFFGVSLPIVLISTFDDVITILVISIVLGLLHIFVALGVNAYMKMRNGDKYGAIADGFGWIAILLGLIILALGSMVFENQLLTQFGGGLSILGVLGIVIASMLGSKNKALGLGLGVYNLYGVTGYIGDIVSYSRLMALGVSGASIAVAFNMIVSFLPPVGRFTVGILLFILLHALNMGLTMLSAYVHGARLILVEFFGKFYEGGGNPFRPLKASEKYIQIKNQIEQQRDGGI